MSIQTHIARTLRKKALILGQDFLISSETMQVNVYLRSPKAQKEAKTLRKRFPEACFVDDPREVMQHIIRKIRGRITKTKGPPSNADIGLAPSSNGKGIQVTIIGDCSETQAQAVRNLVQHFLAK